MCEELLSTDNLIYYVCKNYYPQTVDFTIYRAFV